MKLFWIGLTCFVLGAIFGMWMLTKVVTKTLDRLDKEGC